MPKQGKNQNKEFQNSFSRSDILFHIRKLEIQKKTKVQNICDSDSELEEELMKEDQGLLQAQKKINKKNMKILTNMKYKKYGDKTYF